MTFVYSTPPHTVEDMAVSSRSSIVEENFPDIASSTIHSFQWSYPMYEVNQLVEIVNHSEPSCNGQLGTIEKIEIAYDGYTHYYSVRLEDTDQVCTCTDDEIMEA